MKGAAIIVLIILGAFAIIFLGNSKKELVDDLIVFTQVPGQEFNRESIFPDNGRLVAIQLSNAETSFEVLTAEFKSARSPQVSFDGSSMLFAGKKDENNYWQIWEMELSNKEKTQITFQDSNCTDPAYLPDGSILFSQETNDVIAGEGFGLFKKTTVGTIERITHQPHTDLMSTVSQDGRIITLSKQVYPQSGDTKLLAMRPDGTKASLYYSSADRFSPVSRGYETEDEHFVFIEKGLTSDLVSIRLNRPLHSRQVLSSGNNGGGYHSVYPIENNNFIVSYQETSSSPLGLHIFNPEKNSIESELYVDDEYHSVEPILIKSRPVPRKLPTRVDLTVATGKMLCLNTSITDLTLNEDLKPHSIQVNGLSETLGRFEVEKDGSFYVEINADTPVRFQTFDINGNEILDPSSWLWVRPNESRGCVGCHEDRELAPGNILPEAINHSPVSLVRFKKSLAAE